MNTIRKGAKTAAVAGVATVAYELLAPSVALAESPSGADLLLPKPAEFIPALIAFLIIWFVLGKFAWPSILKMMESRQEKIQNDLNTAENAHVKAEKDQKIAVVRQMRLLLPLNVRAKKNVLASSSRRRRKRPISLPKATAPLILSAAVALRSFLVP